MCSFSGAKCTSRDVTMQIMFLTRKSALIYRRDLRQRVASLTLNCNIWRFGDKSLYGSGYLLCQVSMLDNPVLSAQIRHCYHEVVL